MDFVVSNDLSQIGVLRDALDDLGARFTVPPSALISLQVALDEVVSNVVKYAWPHGGKQKIHVRIEIHTSGLVLHVFDDGQPFDPLKAPEPNRAFHDWRPRPGGVGIHLIKQLVDEFSYERIGDRNHTRLVKNYAIGANHARG